jgi:hypothetical protein
LAVADFKKEFMKKHHLSDSTVASGFRTWLDQLRSVRGHRPLWPVLLGAALDEEFRRQRKSDETYSGEVFINRDAHPLEEGDREERLVARLYREALTTNGCVYLDGHPIWLLGFQWPTQGGVREKKRQADLVGITTNGSLVVFEAKRSEGDPPLIAIAEGLDYLACLLRPKNFTKIEEGFRAWIGNPGKVVPIGFEKTKPDLNIRPKLVILAPESYYEGRQARSIRGRDWPHLARISKSFMESVELHFAATDFKSTTLWKPAHPNLK